MEFGTEQILNAKIKFSFLGIENDALVFQLGFETQGGLTVVTGKDLVDTVTLQNILNTLEVRSWEDLTRKFARIKVVDKKVVSVGNLIENRWVNV